MRVRGLVVAAIAGLLVAGLAARSAERERRAMSEIVGRIRKADYEGDRKALASLAGEMAPYAEKGALASRARYWRGFSLWRRALNGFTHCSPSVRRVPM